MFSILLQGLGLRPGVIDGAISISAVQVYLLVSINICWDEFFLLAMFLKMCCVSIWCIWWTLACNLQINILFGETIFYPLLSLYPQVSYPMTMQIFCIWISCVFFFFLFLSLISLLFLIYLILWEAWHPETFIFNLIYVLERTLWWEEPHY